MAWVGSDSISCPEADERPSLIEYARYHGLCKDFLSLYPLSAESLRLLPELMSFNSALEDLPRLDLETVTCIEEKWSIDPLSALFLQQLLAHKDTLEPDKDSRRSLMKQLKVESPLLSSDNDLDRRVFNRVQKSRQNRPPRSKLKSTCWPQEDESRLYWPSQELTVELMQRAKAEKFVLDKEALMFLQECSSLAHADEIIIPSTPIRKQKKAEQAAARHSPPLLPFSPPFEFGVPNSPVCRIPLATSPADPALEELRKLEEVMDLNDLESLENFSDMSGLEMDEPNTFNIDPPLKRKRMEDFKVEVPLTPAPSSSPTKKMRTVAFSNDLCTMIPAYAGPFSSNCSDIGEKKCSEIFENTIRQNAEAVMRQIENEQLMEADSTLRAEVPRIDQTVPLAPWQTFSRKQMGTTTELEAQSKLISMLKREMIKKHEKWSTGPKVKSGITRWRPFDMQLSDLPGDYIEPEFLDDYKPSSPEDATSGWKADGLRTLDSLDDDEEELDGADIEPMLEQMNLIDSTIDWSKIVGTSSSQPTLQNQQLAPLTSQTIMAARENSNAGSPKIQGKPQTTLSDGFSASNSLDRFMQIHTGKIVLKEPTKNDDPETITITKNVLKESTPSSARPQAILNESTPQLPLHTPALALAIPSRFFVMSSTLLKMRVLMRELERLNSSATYIERDFTSSQTSGCEEADVILAPSCGLLLTTLQKVKQKSLPGQVNRNIVRERIRSLACRYERLFVFVSEGQRGPSAASETVKTTNQMLDQRGCDELASLINFSEALSHGIQVLYVPGNETTLAIWIISYMARFGVDDPEIRLVQEETFWELFLRKAGMDVFAAQAILSKLKRPDSVPLDVRQQDYGLPAFILMGKHERIARFSSMMSGDRILSKVSMAIDSPFAETRRIDTKRP